jgi:hypothetical protein
VGCVGNSIDRQAAVDDGMVLADDCGMNRGLMENADDLIRRQGVYVRMEIREVRNGNEGVPGRGDAEIETHANRVA